MAVLCQGSICSWVVYDKLCTSTNFALTRIWGSLLIWSLDGVFILFTACLASKFLLTAHVKLPWRRQYLSAPRGCPQNPNAPTLTTVGGLHQQRCYLTASQHTAFRSAVGLLCSADGASPACELPHRPLQARFADRTCSSRSQVLSKQLRQPIPVRRHLLRLLQLHLLAYPLRPSTTRFAVAQTNCVWRQRSIPTYLHSFVVFLGDRPSMHEWRPTSWSHSSCLSSFSAADKRARACFREALSFSYVSTSGRNACSSAPACGAANTAQVTYHSTLVSNTAGQHTTTALAMQQD